MSPRYEPRATARASSSTSPAPGNDMETWPALGDASASGGASSPAKVTPVNKAADEKPGTKFDFAINNRGAGQRDLKIARRADKAKKEAEKMAEAEKANMLKFTVFRTAATGSDSGSDSESEPHWLTPAAHDPEQGLDVSTHATADASPQFVLASPQFVHAGSAGGGSAAPIGAPDGSSLQKQDAPPVERHGLDPHVGFAAPCQSNQIGDVTNKNGDLSSKDWLQQWSIEDLESELARRKAALPQLPPTPPIKAEDDDANIGTDRSPGLLQDAWWDALPTGVSPKYALDIWLHNGKPRCKLCDKRHPPPHSHSVASAHFGKRKEAEKSRRHRKLEYRTQQPAEAAKEDAQAPRWRENGSADAQVESPASHRHRRKDRGHIDLCPKCRNYHRDACRATLCRQCGEWHTGSHCPNSEMQQRMRDNAVAAITSAHDPHEAVMLSTLLMPALQSLQQRPPPRSTRPASRSNNSRSPYRNPSPDRSPWIKKEPDS